MTRIRGVVSSVANAPTYRFLQAGIFVVLGIAFATSFSSGSSGAEILGYQPAFVASVPLICDIVAALAMVVHGRVRDDRPMRRLAAWFVLVPMLLSWAANALDHLRRAPVQSHWDLAAQWAWIGGVVVFAGLAPVAVAGLLHFMARYVEHQQRVETGSVGNRVSEPMAETVESEPEFVEPAPIAPRITPRSIETVPEVDDETVAEIDEIETEIREDTPIPAPPRLATVSSASPPWGRRARELKREGVKHATAYRQAKREWHEENEASA